MRIKNKASLVLSIIDCILAIVTIVMCIIDKRLSKLFNAFLMLFFSIYLFQLSIETKKQRQWSILRNPLHGRYIRHGDMLIRRKSK